MTTGKRQGNGARRGTGMLRVLCCLLLLLPPSVGQTEEAFQIKAAFLYNFTKFISWPAAMEQQGGDLRLCLFNGNPFGQYVYQLAGRKVRNFKLQVLEPASTAELATCNIVFMTGTDRVGHALASVAKLPVLTVSDQSGFASNGGAIELISEDNRIRFDVNLQRVRDSGLEMSSKLLQLARQVR